MRVIVLGLGSLCLCCLLGCGVFKSSTSEASSESSSKASSSPFKSSSASSSPSGESDSAYHRDVRDYTARFAASRGDVQAFQRGLGAIAEGYGVTDWERDEATFVAIGNGLAKAQLDESRFRQLAVELANEDLQRLALVKSGYETYARR